MALVATGVGAAPIAAQARPSFAGQWVLVSDSARARPTVATAGDVGFRVGDMGNIWGSPLTLRQERDTLFVEFVHFAAYDLQPPLRYRHALDGSESRNAVMISHAETVLRSRARWEGASLVIETTYPSPSGVDPVQVRQVLSLSPSGELLLETTRPAASGPNVLRAIYRRR